MDGEQKLYKWTKAMNDGSESQAYKQILNHFSQNLTDFNDTTMQQIVGEHSLMHMLNSTFSFNMAQTMGYSMN